MPGAQEKSKIALFSPGAFSLMRIAFSSQNFRTITAHAGKTRRFVLYELAADGSAQEIERLDLPLGWALHDYHGDDHPLFQRGLDLVVTASAGPGFVQRLARHGIRVVTTGATEFTTVLAALAAGRPLPPAPPRGHGPDHDHGVPE